MSGVGDFGRRAIRRIQSTIFGRRVGFVYHRGYELPIPGVPLDPQRAQRIVAYLMDEGLLRQRDVSSPLPASLHDIGLVHTAEYLDQLDSAETMQAVLGFSVSDEEWQGCLDVQRLMTGGTVHATRLARRGSGIAVNLGGGLHHAGPDTGAGFCVMNDVAVSVARLRSKGFRRRIMVIDLDVHDGNGTRAAFRDDPTVHTFSIHNTTWDSRPAVEDTCIELGPDVKDGEYLSAIERELPRVLGAFKPELVLYVAGTDPAVEDRLGDWQISETGMLARDQFVIEQLRGSDSRIPIVVVLGGGYGDNAWRCSARFLGWLLSGRVLDPEEDVDMIVRRFRRIESEAEAKASNQVKKGDWALTADDLMLGMAGAKDSRVFNHFTLHALELQLERLGILNQIRARGFTSPVLTIDSGSELGHTIRLYGDRERSELLVELRARRDQVAIPGTEVLYVEWLLLQNPRSEFDAGRPRLPGQERPGLGLLREFVALLVVICEQAGFDGIVFVPAHYFMAALGRRHLRFVYPEDEAVFHALHEAVGGLDLARATMAIESGRVIDAATGEPVAWHAPPMILPVSERLERQRDHSGPEADYAGVAAKRYVLSEAPE